MLPFEVHVKVGRAPAWGGQEWSGRLQPDERSSGTTPARGTSFPLVLEFRPAMNPRLERMIQLQRAESELKRTQTGQAEVPRRKAELEAELAADRAHLDAARASLDESQKARRRHEGSLQDLEGKRSKYKGQLMDVKTNKEYTAMLHEIEAVEREIRQIEDQILVEMEQAESLTAAVKGEETAFKAREERHKTDVRGLDESAKKLEGEASRLTVERDAVAKELDEDTLALFQRVANFRGSAMAEAKDGMCQACRVKLRLQMYVELKHNLEIVQCPACNRILYYEPPVPVTVVEP
jgi:predicted  nucleic acid-binding Zn-ribbon protein